MPEAPPTRAIRPEIGGDEAQIAQLLTDAFGSTGEADLVAALRRDGDLLSSFAATGFAPFLPPG